MALHFLADGDLGGIRVGEQIVLRGPEAHHAAVVRRVRVGEAVTVGDGAGSWHDAIVDAVSPQEVVLRVTGVASVAPAAPRLVLVQALAKGDRDELAIQAATELGVDEIVPWQAARSVSRWSGPKVAKGVARWQSIVREAAKQAHRAWVPSVAEPVTTAHLCAREALVLVLEPSASERLSAVDLADASEIVLVVGPEGGIAPEELAALADAGARLVRLGDSVLRTSTAGPAALAAVNLRLARW